jgi:hypothetical protein
MSEFEVQGGERFEQERSAMSIAVSSLLRRELDGMPISLESARYLLSRRNFREARERIECVALFMGAEHDEVSALDLSLLALDAEIIDTVKRS